MRVFVPLCVVIFAGGAVDVRTAQPARTASAPQRSELQAAADRLTAAAARLKATAATSPSSRSAIEALDATAAGTETALEFFISTAGRLLQSDHAKSRDTMAKHLKALKEQRDALKKKLLGQKEDTRSLSDIATRLSELSDHVTTSARTVAAAKPR